MNKYLVIGNPIDHSLSPKLHNYWFRENNIDALYEKKQIREADIKQIILDIRNGKIEGINVTVTFKKSVIPFLDKLEIPEKIQSVNTIYREKTIKGSNKIVGRNTDILGFKYSLERIKYSVKGKTILIVTHEEDIAKMCSRIVRLKDGIIVEDKKNKMQKAI